MIETTFVFYNLIITIALIGLVFWLKTIGIQELWKKPVEKRFQEDDVQEKANVFLSLWAAGFEVETVEELNEIMDLAWIAYDEMEELLSDYYVPEGYYFMLMDWRSTGHLRPTGRWRCEMFKPQLMKVGAWN